MFALAFCLSLFKNIGWLLFPVVRRSLKGECLVLVEYRMSVAAIKTNKP